MDRFEPLMAILKDDDDGGGVASSAHATNDKSAAGHFPVSVDLWSLNAVLWTESPPVSVKEQQMAIETISSATQPDCPAANTRMRNYYYSYRVHFARITLYKLTD